MMWFEDTIHINLGYGDTGCSQLTIHVDPNDPVGSGVDLVQL